MSIKNYTLMLRSYIVVFVNVFIWGLLFSFMTLSCTILEDPIYDLKKYTLSYDEIAITENGKKLEAKPQWKVPQGSSAPDDVEYEISRRPEKASDDSVTIDSGSGIVTISSKVGQGDVGTYTITATATDDSLHNGIVTAELILKGSDAKSTLTTPMRIETAEDLRSMGEAEGHYSLANDIELKGQWTPLFSDKPFSGILNGNGHTISGLQISGKEYQGLFAVLKGATVSNLTIEVETIQAKAYVGALAGYVEGPTLIKDITVTPDHSSGNSGEITVSEGFSSKGGSETHHYVGGIVGYIHGNDIKLINGTSQSLTIQVNGSGGSIGGLVGFNSGGTVTGTVNGNLKLQGKENKNFLVAGIGGLVGFNSEGTVTGTIDGNVEMTFLDVSSIGGLVGINSKGTVTGTVTGNVEVNGAVINFGGLVGNNDAGRVVGTFSGNFIGNKQQASDNIGGLVGNNDKGNVVGVSKAVINADGDNIGGLVGNNNDNKDAKIVGYNIGWVMVGANNANHNVGAVVGVNQGGTVHAYYSTNGGDHVGTSDNPSAIEINTGKDGATGKRGNNGLGTGISGQGQLTKTDMPQLEPGDEVGQWTFRENKWPKLNLPDYVRNDDKYYSPDEKTLGNFND